MATQCVGVAHAIDRRLCIPPATGRYAQVLPASVLTTTSLPTAMQVVWVGQTTAPSAWSAYPGVDTADQLAPASVDRSSTPENPTVPALAPTATHTELVAHATDSRSALGTGSLRRPQVDPTSVDTSTAPAPTATQSEPLAHATSFSARTPDGSATSVHVLPPSTLRAIVPSPAADAPAARHVVPASQATPFSPAAPLRAPPGSGISGANGRALLEIPGDTPAGGPVSAAATPTDPAATPNTPSAANTFGARRRRTCSRPRREPRAAAPPVSATASPFALTTIAQGSRGPGDAGGWSGTTPARDATPAAGDRGTRGAALRLSRPGAPRRSAPRRRPGGRTPAGRRRRRRRRARRHRAATPGRRAPRRRRRRAWPR